MNTETSELLQIFKRFSIESTGFPGNILDNTSLSTEYFNVINDFIGDGRFTTFLRFYEGNGIDQLLVSAELSPIARNIIKLWFTGAWEKFSSEDAVRYEDFVNRETTIVSSRAYAEGLLWPTIGANAPGARAAGFGAWSNPPSFDND